MQSDDDEKTCVEGPEFFTQKHEDTEQMQEQVEFHSNSGSRTGHTMKYHTFDKLTLREPLRFHSNIVGKKD